MSLLITFLFLLLIVLTSIAIKKFKIPDPLSQKTYILTFSFIIYFSSFLYYQKQGKDTSQSFINTYKENIVLIKKDKTMISGKFIGLLKNNYFLLIKNKSIFNVISINEQKNELIKIN